ncbi:MAG: T9SS type A sorting domain-containing protein [Bacteroidetes bacterium]|nr:T9SS type A sorting domain-containing protein [Bacteroidota bacterium]MBL7104574.1 T9SS type A sorting domain-containing protein [Bacteroidales bacterium]
MKKLILFSAVFFILMSGYSYTWISFCPDSIYATNACFGVGSSKGVICTPDGMYLHDDYNLVWNYYSNGGLPIWEAVQLNATQILVVMGDGSWSDGIYTFNLQTFQFSVVHWCMNPNFIKYHQPSGTYYVGYQFGGLLNSTDGITWSEVSYFTGKSCMCMDFYENHFVVSEVSNVNNIYWSDDSGNTWNQATGSVPIATDMKFSNQGMLYAVFPDYSNSSGLWRSDDYGDTWEIEFYSDNMSAVGYDAVSNIFVGWESPFAGNEGIALYDPQAPPPGLTFLNEGLPNININKILLNPTMAVIAIFCCTDSGVFFSYDYMVGEEENFIESDQISIYPNPVSNQTTIHINLSDIYESLVSISILNNHGQKVDEIKFETNSSNEFEIKWDKGDLPAGVYYLVIKTKKESLSEKFIIL